jgi:hypothetical protein
MMLEIEFEQIRSNHASHIGATKAQCSELQPHTAGSRVYTAIRQGQFQYGSEC